MFGTQVAYDLKQKGFENLYLATGNDPKDFPELPWIKAITGKSPPFSEVR